MNKEYLGTFYSKSSPRFQAGLLPIARTIKAEKDDLCVVEKIGGGTDCFDLVNSIIKEHWNSHYVMKKDTEDENGMVEPKSG